MLINTNLPYTFNPFARPSTANSSYISFEQLLSYIRGASFAWNLSIAHDQRFSPLGDVWRIHKFRRTVTRTRRNSEFHQHLS